MNEYELCALFSGQQTEEEINELAKQVESLLSQANAEVKFKHSLGRKKLAYSIKGQTHCEYRCWLFLAEPSEIPTLNDKLRLSQIAIRHLISKFENFTIEDRIAKIKDVKPTTDSTDYTPAPPTGRDYTDKKKREEEPEKKKEDTEEKPAKKEKKISLDHLDEKLDELLKSDKI